MITYSYTITIGGEDSWDDTNVRVNVDYTPNDNQLWYLSFTTGFRSGGYALGVSGQRDDARDEFGIPNGTGSVLVSYDQEKVEAVELGYKGLHLDDTLQIFASIYHYDYDGYQDEMQQFDPIRGAGANFVSNADGITNEGFEIVKTLSPYIKAGIAKRIAEWLMVKNQKTQRALKNPMLKNV